MADVVFGLILTCLVVIIPLFVWIVFTLLKLISRLKTADFSSEEASEQDIDEAIRTTAEHYKQQINELKKQLRR